MADQMFLTEEIKKKWAPVIDHADVPAIKETWKKRVTTIMLENTAREISKSQQLNEDAPANAAGAFPNATNLKGFDPILISLIRRAMPNLLAYDLCGVQPMTGPTGLIFAMRSRYTTQTGAETFYNEVNTQFSSVTTGANTFGQKHVGQLPTGVYN